MTKMLHFILPAVLGLYAFAYVRMPAPVHICLIFEINKKQNNNEGIFQEMTH